MQEDESLFDRKCELAYLVNTTCHAWTVQEVWEFLGTPDWDVENDLTFNISPGMSLDEMIKNIVWDALVVCEFSQKKAAEYLGISPRSINYHIKQNGWKHPNWPTNKRE